MDVTCHAHWKTLFESLVDRSFYLHCGYHHRRFAGSHSNEGFLLRRSDGCGLAEIPYINGHNASSSIVSPKVAYNRILSPFTFPSQRPLQ